MTEEKKKQIREQIGIILLAGILFMSGMIIMKQPNKQATFTESAVSGAVTSLPNTGQKSAVGGSTQTLNNKSTLVNINKASLEELDTLPGVGPATAQKIIDYRSQNGLFRTIEEINDVSGIGEVKYSQIKDLISI